MIDNPKAGAIRRAVHLQRKKERLARQRFLIEGPHAVVEALRAIGDDIEVVYATDDVLAREPEVMLLADRAQVIVERATAPVLATLSDTVSPQGIVAVARFTERELTSDELPASARVIAVLHEVRDPGNAGAVIRGADASGADAVIFSGDSIDPWHPKVVRASAGSLFHLPVFRERDMDRVLSLLTERGITTLATDLSGHDLNPRSVLLTAPHAWVFGNEARGLPSAVTQACDAAVKLPIYGRAESLNLATAATVCMYASAFVSR